MKKWIAVAAAILALFGGWYYASPRYTLNAIRAAAEARDAKALSAYVDYDALRVDLKADINRKLMTEAQQRSGDQMGSFATIFALAMTDPLIDAVVTPAGVEAMFARARAAAAKPGLPSLPSAPAKQDKTVIERRGLNEFVVRGQDASKGAMVFKREGVGWKLAGVELPGE